MAVTADSVIVDLEARTTAYESNMKRAATTAETSMSKVDTAVKRTADTAERALARSANASRNLGRQIADVGSSLASGSSPFIILAQQAPQVADALADTTGKAATMARFFAGPWGAAILAGASVLGVLAGKAFEAGGELDAAGKKALLAAKNIAEAGDRLREFSLRRSESQKLAEDFGNAGNNAQLAAAEVRRLNKEIRALPSVGDLAGAPGGLAAQAAAESRRNALVARRDAQQKIVDDNRNAIALAERRRQFDARESDPVVIRTRQINDLQFARDKVGAADRKNIDAQIKDLQTQIRLIKAGVTPDIAGQSTRGGSGRSGPSAETLAKRAEAARIKGIRDDEAFANQVASLNDQILQARRNQSQDASEQAEIERQLVREKAAKVAQQIEADRQAKKYTDDEAKTLRVLNALATQEQINAIDLTEAERLRRQQNQITTGQLESQRSILLSEAQLADTAAERRAIALRIVDLEFQIEQAKIDELAKSRNPVDRAEAATRQGSLDERRVLATAGAIKSTMDPWEAQIDSFPNTIGKINDALKKTEADGLRAFNDGIADAVVNGKSLGDVFHQISNQIIADLIRIALQFAESQLFGGGATGGLSQIGPTNLPIGGGGGGGFLGSLLGIGTSILGSIGGGSGGGFGSGCGSDGVCHLGADRLLFGRASGGYVEPHGLYRVNEGSGRAELLRMGSQGGEVIPLGRAHAARGGGGVSVFQTVNVDARNSVNPDGFERRILSQANDHANRAAATAGQSAYKAAPAAVNRQRDLGTT